MACNNVSYVRKKFGMGLEEAGSIIHPRRRQTMARFKRDIRTDKSPEELTCIIANYLTAKGYTQKRDSQQHEWRKGVYWIKYLTFAFTPGKVAVEAWINVPLAGFGSYIKYFLGKKELQDILKELETYLASSSPGQTPDWLTNQALAVEAASAQAAPGELKRWNWAAFLWGPVWAIGHNVWIGLLTLIPYVGLVMFFVLGAKGNQWAWEKNSYGSLEQFQARQNKWIKAWFLTLGLLIVLAVFIPFLVRNR